MVIRFHTTKLEKVFSCESNLIRQYGAEMTKKIRRRMDELRSVDRLSDLGLPKSPPARCHELTGGERGRQCQLSVDLKDPYRLIFVPDHDPIPKKSDGGLDWEQVSAVEILKVENTHGK